MCFILFYFFCLLYLFDLFYAFDLFDLFYVFYLFVCFRQAQFQLASPVPVQLRTEISLIITVTPTHPGKYI